MDVQTIDYALNQKYAKMKVANAEGDPPMNSCPKCGSASFSDSYDNEAYCLMCGFTPVRVSQVVLNEVKESMGHNKLKADLNRWKNSLTH